MDEQEKYMREAIKMADKAERRDEVPVGAVIVKRGEVIARAYNLRETKKDPLAHAEVLAIKKAAKRLRSWRLENCVMYVTLEPCPMCAGAIVNSRIKKVVFGAYDPKAGALGSLYDLAEGKLNHIPQVSGGFLKDECSAMLKKYFLGKRS
jgi:tRNA(adenine34) deaminase